MSITPKQIESYCNKFDNRFIAINNIVKEVKSLAKTTYKDNLYSEIFDYLLSGNKLPKHKKRQLSNLQNILSEISDPYIIESVVQSIKFSNIFKRLNYMYLPGMSSGDKARVRVICNMIWYNII